MPVTATIESGSRRLYSVDEAAQRHGASGWTYRAHIARGNIKVVRIGRLVRISEDELARIEREGLPSLK